MRLSDLRSILKNIEPILFASYSISISLITVSLSQNPPTQHRRRNRRLLSIVQYITNISGLIKPNGSGFVFNCI